MANQDVVLPGMVGGIAPAAAMPGSLFACRGAVASTSLRRSAYLCGGLHVVDGGAGAGADGDVDEYGRGLAPAAHVVHAAARPRGVTTSTGSSWVAVEDIRASSPTTTRSPAAAAVDEYTAWTRKHPSALGSFEQIAAAAMGKQVVVFMDYDGTLSPIVTDPDMAFMTDEMRTAVHDVVTHFPAAIVTGRCVDKVRSFVGLSGLYYAGSHGMDIKGPSSNDKDATTAVLLQPARDFLPVIAEAYEALVEKTKTTPGAKVENNKFCLSVHFRCVDEKRWSPLAEEVKAVLRAFPDLKLTEGRKVLEIRPCIMWDKGKAVEFLLKSLGLDGPGDVLPVYLGDDRTDEDAFKVIRKRDGVGMLVSKCPRDTHASHSLQDPTEVMEFLLRLVQWKRRQSAAALAKV